MGPSTPDLRSAAIISVGLVLPFVILESVNQTITEQNAPGLAVLFGVLWLLPTAFIVTVVPMLRTMRAGNSILAKPVSFWFKLAFAVLIAMIWSSLLLDQLPCFLGVPNCD